MKVATLTCLIALCAEAAALAQTPMGTVAGIISDGSQAVVADVQIALTKVDTGQVRVALSSVEGHYTVDSLAPGR
jgi:hypothetical protein